MCDSAAMWPFPLITLDILVIIISHSDSGLWQLLTHTISDEMQPRDSNYWQYIHCVPTRLSGPPTDGHNFGKNLTDFLIFFLWKEE